MVPLIAGHIELYRASRARCGYAPAGGRVSLMLHTFVSLEARLDALTRIGVDEIACLVDFGVAPAEVFESLELLSALVGAGGTLPRTLEEAT